MPKLMSLSDLAPHYDGLLCDIWGVLHNGIAAFPDAVDALCKYRAQGGIVILITNAPRSNQVIYPQLAGLGVPRKAFDAIVTSGDMARLLLQEQPDTPLFHFGPARDQSTLEGLTNPMVSPRDAYLCLLTGPLDDGIENAQIYEPVLREMCDNAVHMICANPDLVVKSGNRMVICAGSIAQLYAQLGGRVTYAGKPEAPIYDASMAKISIAAGRQISRSRILVVGDGLPTDIKGAAQNVFDAYFVAGGIHSDDVGDMQTPENLAHADGLIRHQFTDVKLAGICNQLRWI
ncbi:TIGR01459 family HAD-type hydrolase [Rhodobacteraceae bacterium KMM 6894]|nr:TIGR01459 family HAD-type hydrolase [Rhodobacteraceae bacterium KMM 6894]